MNTRYASTQEASDAAPERLLASGKLRGIAIGLNVITRVARIRTERERKAMIWLHNYARLENLTADALSDELDLSKPDIRAALTDPDFDLARFVRQVEAIRKKFEAGLPDLVQTRATKILNEGLHMAKKMLKPVEIIGLTRMGKSVPGFNWFLKNGMDCGIFVTCPEDNSDRTFIFEVARTLGISTTGGKKTSQLRPQIRGCFGKNMLQLIIVDEGHFLWPADKKSKPQRLEFVRAMHDMDIPSQIGSAIMATPQFTLHMNIALAENGKWAPGQWDGRVIRYHLPDTMSDADLRAVAKHHAPDFAEGMIEALVMHAKATSGFCGAMVNAIELAREKAELRGLKKPTPDILLEAQKQMVAGTKIEQLAKHLKSGNTETRRAA